MKIMVAYDGTLQAKEALAYGIEKVREKGGEVVALHVFNSGMFLDYDAHPDAESLARRESARFVDEAKALIREKGNDVRAGLFSAEGDPEEETIKFARERNVDVLLCPRGFRSIIGRYQKSQAQSDLAKEAERLNLAALSTKTM